MSAHTEGDDPRLAELLLRWEELHDEGRSVTADELCSTCPELAAELGRRIALLRRFGAIGDGTTAENGGKARPAPAGGTRRSATARAEFTDLRFHAAGALGEVFMARNAELNREVALKFLKAERGRDADSRRRFLQEAEVTGRLEHPGVVPIYALGTDASGSPCYAMRFIRGETLQDAIDAFHAAEKPGRNPTERSLALRELLNRFVSICNTMGYAHSRGILHRDLKPRNVMLGKYDETLVVDWGLARTFERDDAARSIGEETLMPGSGSGEDGSDTPTVGVVGTPAYMSPEQAEARWDLVGPASDIFSLGGILYAILTGRAPYQGNKVGALLENVKRCEYPPPRQVKPGVPRALEAICLKAMSRRPEDRYAGAVELARDVKRWLADEPVAAWREPPAIRARRWMRRNRSLVIAACAAVLVGLVALGIGYAHTSAINRRLDEANRRVTAANRELQGLNEELKEAHARITQSKAESDRRLDQALQAHENYYTGVSRDFLLGQKEFRDLRSRLLERPQQFYEQLAKELETSPSPDDRTRALLAKGRLDLARIFDTLGRKDEAKANSRAAIARYRQLIAAQPDSVAYRDGLAASLNALAIALRDTGDHRHAAEALREASDVLSKLSQEPSNRAARLQEQSNVKNNTAIVLRGLGDLNAASDSLRAGIAIQTELVSEHPEVPDYRSRLANLHNSLSTVLQELGDYARAAESARKAIDIATRLIAEHPDKSEYQVALTSGHSCLGLVFDETGDYRAAAAEHRRVIDEQSKLAAAYPNVLAFQHGQAIGCNNLGRVLTEIGDFTGAAEAYRSGIAIRSGLAARFPQLPDNLRGIANKSTNLGVVLQRMGNLDGAASSFREAIRAWDRLATDHPDVPDYQTGLARAFNNLATVQIPAKDYSGATDSLRKAIAIQEKLVAAHPSIVDLHLALGLSWHNLGEISQALREHEEAIRLFRRAVESQRRAMVLAPRTARARGFLDGHYLKLAAALRSVGRIDDAIATARERLPLAADRSAGLYNLACDLALCAPIARDASRRQELADQAMDTLRSAVAAGFLAAAHASRDPDLASLRDRDDFRRLLADLFDRGFPDDPFAR